MARLFTTQPRPEVFRGAPDRRDSDGGPLVGPLPGGFGNGLVGGRLRARASPAPLIGIWRRLATGGMAEIYVATAATEGFERLVVLKRLLPHLADDPEIARMFHDEARIAATLGHPNIVQVFDVAQTPRETFICMEYLEGGTLEALQRALRTSGRALPLDALVMVALGAAAGLHHAHEQVDLSGRPLAIVHRDVSPANVFVTYDGAVKVLDFGIAKAARRLTKTIAGGLKGKIGFMAPEQARGGEVDRRADVYSLCATLWTLADAGPRLPDVDDVVLLPMVAAGPPVPRPGPRVRPRGQV